MQENHVYWIIIACWVIFICYWVATAGSAKTTVERESRGSRLAYQWPMLLAYVLLFYRSRFPAPLRFLNARWAPAGHGAAGAVVVVLGLAGAIWARRVLGGNWSSAVTIKQDHQLVERGPYRWVRNPIYTSMLLMFVGTALAIGETRGWLAAALAAASFWMKLKREEAFMLRRFPEEFPAYQRRVKALIPGVL